MALADMVVVMNEGEIEQIDTPQDVYNRPASQFVARFIGGHNVFNATVTESSKTGTRLNGSQEPSFSRSILFCRHIHKQINAHCQLFFFAT